MRATVLSFKGLAFNVSYGLLGLLYSALVAAQSRGLVRQGVEAGAGIQDLAFREVFAWFPGTFAAGLAGLVILYRVLTAGPPAPRP
jgi:hypothetical protein